MPDNARDIEQIKALESAKHGKGRALYRRQQLGLQGAFEVLSGLPVHARHGLFAQPGGLRGLGPVVQWRN